jgi:unsaturated rhamnogalacturonyl hydrolase
MTNLRLLIFSLLILCTSFLSTAKQINFGKWEKGFSPREVGDKLAARYAASPFTDFGLKLPATHITYPEACAWFGALKFAGVTANKELSAKLEQRFQPLLDSDRKLVPKPEHVDATVFGIIPLQLYQQTKKHFYLDYGLHFADAQWEMPDNAGANEAKYKTLQEDGYSWQTRYWVDDMFMISAIQVQAFRATGNRKYIDRAAHEMVSYLNKIQQPNGLYFHAENAPFFWGRGNGWMAAGMTELLSDLPEDNPDKSRILTEYVKMMHTLKSYQNKEGLWNQLIDDPACWSETSSTGMFTYAMVVGVKKGWLNEGEFKQVIRKAWIGLVGHINSKGDITDVCEGTNKTNDRQFYLNRKRITGDLHGQAPVLWAAAAFLSH